MIPPWCWWIGVVLLLSFPFEGATAQPQWHRVNWVPFAGAADKLSDVVANVLLLMPFGWWLTGPRWHTQLRSVAVATAAVAIGAESLQLFSTTRYPSATDISCAVAGALLGAMLRRSFAPRAASD